MFRSPLKEIIGSAEPAVPDEELDVTIGKPKDPVKEPEATGAVVTPSFESPGLSLVTKLCFFGVIVGVVFGLLRTRKPGIAEKSLA